jgi:hypothetical protein
MELARAISLVAVVLIIVVAAGYVVAEAGGDAPAERGAQTAR